MVDQMFQPIKQERVYVQVINQIYDLINKGKLKPGDKMPPERVLVKELKASRTSIREALSFLRMIGVLERKVGQGTFISDQISPDTFKPMMLMLSFRNDGSKEIFEIRRILESECAYLAAERATAEDKKKIRNILDDIEKVEDADQEEDLDARFHTIIAETTHNKILIDLTYMVSELIRTPLKENRELIISKYGRERIIEDHKEILDAISNKDPYRAREAMGAHLSIFKEFTDSNQH